MEEFSSLFASFLQPSGSMEDRVAKHAEFSKSAMEKGMSNVRDISDMVAKANSDAFGVLSRRMSESFDEMRDYASKRAVG